MSPAPLWQTTQMKTLFLTGASDGIGRALVDQFLEDDWHIVATGRRPRDQVTPKLPDIVDYLQADLAGDLAPLLTALAPYMDQGRFDLAILNAGVGRVADLDAMAAQEITQILSINTVVPLALAQGLFPALSAGKGSLVFVGSTAASGAHPDFATYAASKAAIKGAARSLRLEWQDQIKVIDIHPGPTATGMHDKAGLGSSPMRRLFTRPDRVAARIKRAALGSASCHWLGLGFTLRHAMVQWGRR